MQKIFNFTSSFKALEDDDGSVMIRGMASTDATDRANDVIKAEAWAKGGLENFKTNPIILFNHNYDKPIGRATGVKVTENGLELEAKISKSAPDNVAMLIKEGILGAFSVGFRVKDADYIKETDGLLIKDAELFEVSVVSVPCNQAATFSLAKSFDSMAEYEEFKKSFIDNNSVDLAGQSLAEDEVNAFEAASETPDETVKSVEQEKTMSDVQKTSEIDLEAFAKKVAADTAAQIAMKQAEEKAAAEKAAKAVEQAKAAEQAKIDEKAALLAEVEAKLAEKAAEFAKSTDALKAELAEKNEEIVKMRESKKVFADRSEKSDISAWGEDFMKAHILGVMTQKGWNTRFGQELAEKAGIDYATNASGIEVEVSARIEKEIMRDLKVARLFREITMNSATQILPLQSDTNMAVWNTGGENAGTTGLGNKGGAAGTFNAKKVTLEAHRLISTTYMDNHIDEEVLVNLMPMLVEGVARAHARAVESAILLGNGGDISGLDGMAATATTTLSVGSNTALTADILLSARSEMGKYGLMPDELVFIVDHKGYYDLLNDADFQTITEVGSDVATRVVGSIGAVYGTPVVVSEELPGATAGNPAAFCVNKRNFVIPRLRGVSVEQDYEVAAQRRVIVASQSLGFNRLVADAQACVKIDYAA